MNRIRDYDNGGDNQDFDNDNNDDSLEFRVDPIDPEDVQAPRFIPWEREINLPISRGVKRLSFRYLTPTGDVYTDNIVSDIEETLKDVFENYHDIAVKLYDVVFEELGMLYLNNEKITEKDVVYLIRHVLGHLEDKKPLEVYETMIASLHATYCMDRLSLDLAYSLIATKGDPFDAPLIASEVFKFFDNAGRRPSRQSVEVHAYSCLKSRGLLKAAQHFEENYVWLSPVKNL